MSFHHQLHEATMPERDYLLSAPIIRDCLAGNISRADYLSFLEEAYHHVKHTVPLLMACGSRLPERLEWLRHDVAEYIEEEIGHEEWVLDDIEACGGNRDEVRTSAPRVPTDLMVAYAYDTVFRRNPVGFFGMVFVLEGTSIALATHAAEVIQRTLGLPDRAFSYLRSHGSLDESHIQFLKSILNRLERECDRTAVLQCARCVYRSYADMFRELRVPRNGLSPQSEREVA